MITKIKYGDFLFPYGNSVFVTTDKKQTWEYRRFGICEDDVKKKVKELDKTEAVKVLVEEGKLIPVYGGEIVL